MRRKAERGVEKRRRGEKRRANRRTTNERRGEKKVRREGKMMID